MWETKANQVNARDRVCPHTAVHQLCSMTERNYVMKLLDSVIQGADGSKPILFPTFSLWYF